MSVVILGFISLYSSVLLCSCKSWVEDNWCSSVGGTSNTNGSLVSLNVLIIFIFIKDYYFILAKLNNCVQCGLYCSWLQDFVIFVRN